MCWIQIKIGHEMGLCCTRFVLMEQSCNTAHWGRGGPPLYVSLKSILIQSYKYSY